MKKVFSIVLLLFVAVLIGCSKESKSYYPLKEGKSWKYQVTMKQNVFGMDQGGSTEISITNMAQREIKGKKTIPQKYEAAGKGSNFSFIVDDKDGVYEYASQSSGDVEPKIEEKPAYYFKYPLEAGKGWEEEGRTSLISSKVPVKLKANIESVDDTVTVAAGTFKGCLKVKKTGSAKKTTKTFLGTQTVNVSIDDYKWFAPGVGLVKWVVKENQSPSGFGASSPEMSIELAPSDKK